MAIKKPCGCPGNLPVGVHKDGCSTLNKASTDGLTRFIIKVAGKQGRGRHWTPTWLFVTQICEAENYRVKKFQWGANRDRAQRMGKLQAEQMAESIRKGHRIQAVVEPEVQ